ncbi:sulfotransferase family protein [Salipiger sp. P9]|uniref:sulfotransferase family protein n=1 Tax=Salipiger pentaromativorans TaxID=2943193 RepID=UPI0021574531|nr:sulfotransferase family protein [Salipiger pentaromativorans]MCR8548330.1 sulfotransferase family protein [Salipiger pentaromativorans]
MIISHAHKFIFVHSRKTAGSSVTACLNRHLGPWDIQLGAWPESIASGGSYNLRAVLTSLRAPGYLLQRSLRYSREHRRLALCPNAVNRITKHHFQNRHGFTQGAHAKAAEVRAYAPEPWARYFKFGIVRNPWTHAVSDYYWRRHVCGGAPVGFKEYLLRLDDLARPDPEGIRPPLVSNWEIYAIGDALAVDFVGRYENLAEDLAAAGRHIGLSLDISGIRAKGGIRNDRKPISEHYDDESVEIVRRVYAHEVARFDYQPPF